MSTVVKLVSVWGVYFIFHNFKQSHAGNNLPTFLSDEVPRRGNAEQLKIPVGLNFKPS